MEAAWRKQGCTTVTFLRSHTPSDSSYLPDSEPQLSSILSILTSISSPRQTCKEAGIRLRAEVPVSIRSEMILRATSDRRRGSPCWVKEGGWHERWQVQAWSALSLSISPDVVNHDQASVTEDGQIRQAGFKGQPRKESVWREHGGEVESGWLRVPSESQDNSWLSDHNIRVSWDDPAGESRKASRAWVSSPKGSNLPGRLSLKTDSRIITILTVMELIRIC